jgi:hypothetical protein
MSPPGAVTPGQMPAHFAMPPSPSPIPTQAQMAQMYVDTRNVGHQQPYPIPEQPDLKDWQGGQGNAGKASRAPKLAPLDVFHDGPRDRLQDNRVDTRAEEEAKLGGWVVDRRLDLAAVRERAWLEAAADMQAAALSGEWKVPERLRSTLQEVLAGPA